MNYTFDRRQLAEDIQAKLMAKGNTVSRRSYGRTIRTKRPQPLSMAAAPIGLSASTMSRISRGEFPDIRTFAMLCSWLKKSPATYFKNRK